MMVKFLSQLFLQCFIIDAAITSVFGAYCSGKPEPGERISAFPIHDELKPRLIRSVKNAMLFEAGPINSSFPIVHIWGNPYEIGSKFFTFIILIKCQVLYFQLSNYRICSRYTEEGGHSRFYSEDLQISRFRIHVVPT